MIGKTIAHYKILEKLGGGGMGVVYKAEDTKLDRFVALKFLPPNLSENEKEKQRFMHEAKAASALQHNNICTIHQIDETADGQMFICMAYYEGETLKKKIERGPLNMEEAIDIAMQIAQGLERAHEVEIVHRDVKPANIMLTNRGEVKIVDFGLAKLAGRAMLTREGSTVGTAAYMSPEQAQGQTVDHRSDIFSFGVVLYEMATGNCPFAGEYEAAMMYSIVNEHPAPPSELQQGMPKELERIIFKCLEKQKEDRYQSAEHLLTDVKKLKKDIGSEKHTAIATQRLQKSKTRKNIPLALIASGLTLVLASVILVIGFNIFKSQISEPRIIQSRALTTTTLIQEFAPKISPDGMKVSYASDEDGRLDLWVKQIVSGQKINLTKDHEGKIGGFAWSPDGEWIAFASSRDGGGIYVISEYGGALRKIVAHNFVDLGPLSWSPDGRKLTYTVNGDLYTVMASGGVPEHIPLPYKVRDPAWSHDGKRIVYLVGELSHIQAISNQIWTIRADGSDSIEVFDGIGLVYSPTWAADGKRIFFKMNRGGTRDIWWVPVDRNGKPTGSAKPLTVGLNTFDFSFSRDGCKLAYSIGGSNVNIWSLPLGADRVLSMNDALQITHENQFIYHVAMSPDHNWLAFNSWGPSGLNDLWLMRKDGKGLRQVTADSIVNMYPSWSPDGKHLAFSSYQTGNRDIYKIPVEGGPATTLNTHPARDEFPSWSPDGNEIVFFSDRSGNLDLWKTSVSGEAIQLTNNDGADRNPLFSPDGRFISFLSDRKGAWDLYLLPAGGGEPKQLTHVAAKKTLRLGIGETPMGHVWSPEGKTIYVTFDAGKDDPGNKIWAISVEDGSIRKILDYKSEAEDELLHPLATDGETLYFIMRHPTGDIWLAELECE
jgi:Tol biopolymer transport system component